jgi:hypothetical protein
MVTKPKKSRSMESKIAIGEFNKLHEALQHETIWKHGFLTDRRTEGGYEIITYKVFDFCVEVYYDIAYSFYKELKSFECMEA